MPQELLTVPEVAKLLRVKVARCYELARTGQIPVVKIGRQVRVDGDRLATFIREGGAPLPDGWRRAPQR
ncbi:MAG: helix-turn-helix domain-containing protein [Acidobacteriia bacterium]|nr:helix-turn-helix domain-containing protein [Terriglobia bacterium]